MTQSTTKKITVRHKDGGVVSQHGLNDGEYVIGRDQFSDILIDDEYVSQQHAKLFISGDTVEIEDLNSSSNTSIDDVIVSDRITVHPGQRIHICDFYLDISMENLTENTESLRLAENCSNPCEGRFQWGIGAIFLFGIGLVLWLSIFRPSSSGSKSMLPDHRSRDEIFRDKIFLPTLYLTGKTGQRVVLSEKLDYFLDEKTGEICWRALECQNPDCPARAAAGNLHLFIIPEPGVFLKPDRLLGFDDDVARRAAQSGKVEGCPECMKIRDLESELPAIREQYADYVQPHVLPESAKRIEELNNEYRRRVESENRQN